MNMDVKWYFSKMIRELLSSKGINFSYHQFNKANPNK